MAALAALMILLGGPARCQGPAAVPSGYVVRTESGAVYLDLGEASGAAPGQAFEVFVEGEELKHPVTKASLGRLETKVAAGTLREVMPKYSVGSLASSAAEVKAGMRARLLKSAAAPAVAGPGDKASVKGREPRWKSAPFPFSATGLAVADLRGDGKQALALSDDRSVTVYDYPPQDAKPFASWKRQGTGPKIFSLEAADLDGDGRAEVFVTLYNDLLERLETAVLRWDGTAELKLVAEYPGATRGYRDASGRKALAVQQLNDDNTFPFSPIYPLSFKDGKFGHGKEKLSFSRVEWVYDFTLADLGDGEPAVLGLTSTNRLRIGLGKKAWKTNESYGQTPQRLRWPRANGRLLEFHPPIEVGYGADKKPAVYLVKNISVLGSLSEPFGFFNEAEVQRQSWDGVSLKADWKAPVGGFIPAVALVGAPGGAQDLTAAVVGAGGKSAVWIYDP